MKSSVFACRRWFVPVLAVFLCNGVYAQRPSGIPQLESRPGADYTIYLNVGGFEYDGTWSGIEPGYTAPLNDIPDTGTFSTVEQTQISVLWAQVASSFVGFNVNVTTIDPYDSVGNSNATDADRQAFYDATPNMLHTVIGSQVRNEGSGPVKWYSNDADGVSGLGIAAGIAANPGDHTNWMFSEAQAGDGTGGVINGAYIGAVTAHENAHAFGLYHQSDYSDTTSTLVNEYSLGDDAPEDGAYVPIIGQADGRQRVAFRVGDADVEGARTVQNDVAKMLSTSSIAGSGNRTGAADLMLIDDGIGGTRDDATTLALTGDIIDVSSRQNKGVIVPLNSSDLDPLGVEKYTENWHSFYTDGMDAISLMVNNGTDFLSAGVADLLTIDSMAGLLRSKLTIFDATGSVVGTGVESDDTLTVSFSDLLAQGNYFAQVQSFGGHVQDAPAYSDASYFDMGAYFLTGSGFDVSAVPEPSSIAFCMIGFVAVVGSRRRRR
ncbi:hypothetical protein Q31b_32460 [Novipirellula aureliae]|uniref:PEP-CTERM protein-sorting domain-containing protein n=2 Tax=Novipirellula aureliae TaxID=2527966 RepID=A0A5C6DT81_9BACT|nr:hypothetical protein Q31b_32460 [Novipirellula aureliae]